MKLKNQKAFLRRAGEAANDKGSKSNSVADIAESNGQRTLSARDLSLSPIPQAGSEHESKYDNEEALFVEEYEEPPRKFSKIYVSNSPNVSHVSYVNKKSSSNNITSSFNDAKRELVSLKIQSMRLDVQRKKLEITKLRLEVKSLQDNLRKNFKKEEKDYFDDDFDLSDFDVWKMKIHVNLKKLLKKSINLFWRKI